MSLDTLQSEFQQYLISSDNSKILSAVEKNSHFPAHLRLQIYHDAYRLRLLDILKQDFLKTLELLGDAEFDNMFFAYLAQHPSKHFSVRYFGQHLHAFLANTAPYSQFPVIAEMAQFEWLVGYTIDAANGPIVSIADLAAIPFEEWPELAFRFHPSLTSHYFNYDTPQLWQDIEADKEPRTPQKQPHPTRWMFYRKGLRSFFLSCSPIEDKIFQGIAAGQTFGDICEILLDDLPEDQIALVIAQTLHKWISEEMISAVMKE